MKLNLWRGPLLGLALAAAIASPALAKPHAVRTAPVSATPGWVAAWASSQMVPDSKNAIPAEDVSDVTLRQVFRISAGGSRFRIRLSNAMGTTPLRIDAVEVAPSDGAARIKASASHAVTFAGQTGVTIPAGAEYVSDAIDMPVAALDDLTVSTWQPNVPVQQTGHPGARANSYLLHGNHTADADFAAPKVLTQWFEVGGIEVQGGATTGAIAIVGDSITDGYGVQPNTNARWPDTLMRRLNEAKIPLAVLNQGIGGNRLLLDGTGPNAIARLDRDVLTQPNVRYLIVLDGVNDLGMSTRDAPIAPEEHAALVAHMIAGYSQIVDRARVHGIKVYGATILPYGGNGYYHPDASNEADRQALNAWIRAPGHFDAVIDFDVLARDPAAPEKMKAELDSGDHLHPSPAGYKVMGEYVDLKLFGQ